MKVAASVGVMYLPPPGWALSNYLDLLIVRARAGENSQQSQF